MTVSILIPAFRPTWLGQAIASVLTQGYEDFELLVSDDSVGDEVRAVVDRFRDPRLIYSRTGGLGKGGAENLRVLWRAAKYPTVKYLFDDDLLLPNALQSLVDALDARAQASFVFGHRDVIDERGRVRAEPRFIAPGKVVELDRASMAAALLPHCANRVGEFSNIMINRNAGITLDDILSYHGFELEMLVDVAFYIVACSKGPAVGLGQTVAHYRKHAQQNSVIGFNPRFYKGFAEWELFLRGEYADGHLTPEQALAGISKLSTGYEAWGDKMQELGILRAGLDRFRTQVLAGDTDVFDSGFQADWSRTIAAAEARNLEQPATLA